MKYAKYDGNVIVAIADVPQPAAGITTEVADDHADILAYTARQSRVDEISDRQFFQQLAVIEEITEQEALDAMEGKIPAAMEALIDGLPVSSSVKFDARMKLKGATKFYRSDPLVATIGAAYGWTDEQIDAFWAAAATI